MTTQTKEPFGLKRLVQGAVAGALIVAIGGNWFPGYTLDSANARNVADAEVTARHAVHAEICAAQARVVQADLAEFQGMTSSYAREQWVQAQPWSTAPGVEKLHTTAARGCVELLKA